MMAPPEAPPTVDEEQESAFARQRSARRRVAFAVLLALGVGFCGGTLWLASGGRSP